MKHGSMRCPIPEDMREQLAADPFMHVCILNDAMCEGRIEWNHAFTYAGKRQNVIWGILPMCNHHHGQEAKWRPFIEQVMRKRVKYFNAAEDFRAKYPKSTLI